MLGVLETILPRTPASFDVREWRILVETVALHRLLLLNRDLVLPEKAFAAEDILEDPWTYRSVLWELDRRHNYDREKSIPLFASFFGLDRAAAESLAASEDAFDQR